MTTPRFATIMDWVEGRLDPQESAEVERALDDAGESGAKTVRWATEFLEASRALPLVAPPEEVRDDIRAAFRRHHAPRRPDTFHDVEVSYDSREFPAVAGVRSASAAEAAHVALDAEGFRMTLTFTDAAGVGVDIHGELESAPSPDASAVTASTELTFTGPQTPARVVRPGPDGRFLLTAVDDAVDEVWIEQGETRLRARLNLRRRD